MTFIPGERIKKRSNFEWNRVQRQYWGTWNIRKQFSILGEQGNKPIYFRGTYEPLEGSHKRSNFQTIHQFVCLFIRLSTRHTKLCLWSTDSMYVKTCILYSSNIHCNVWPHTMINTTFAEKYAAEIYEVSLLSWAYSSSTHFAINRMYHWYLWFCKAHVFFLWNP